jgi:hypothetical protein
VLRSNSGRVLSTESQKVVTNSEGLASGNAKWYFTESEGLADVKMYFTKSEGLADVKVYFTKSEGLALCEVDWKRFNK